MSGLLTDSVVVTEWRPCYHVIRASSFTAVSYQSVFRGPVVLECCSVRSIAYSSFESRLKIGLLLAELATESLDPFKAKAISGYLTIAKTVLAIFQDDLYCSTGKTSYRFTPHTT